MLRKKLLILFVAIFPSVFADNAPDPTDIIQRSIDHWRGQSSWAQVEMTIHRPDWERSMRMDSWTQNDTDALIRFTAPAKDAGNATLKLDQDMWIFTPKLNQIIKLPASMMAQSWMGSDFSYNDLAKSDQVLAHFTHRIIEISESDGHVVYTIEAIPKADAPIVWGKEVLSIRDDFVLLQEAFYDQNMRLIKRMETTIVSNIGGRPYPVEMVMRNFEETERWTRIVTSAAQFDIELPPWIFTQSNLRNPRPWRPRL